MENEEITKTVHGLCVVSSYTRQNLTRVRRRGTS
jgi:hypothetical protein